MVIVYGRIFSQSSVTRLAEGVSGNGLGFRGLGVQDLGFREVESEKSLQRFKKSRAHSTTTGSSLEVPS